MFISMCLCWIFCFGEKFSYRHTPPHFVSCPPRDAQSENINWFYTHCLFARNPTNFSSLKTKNKKPTAHVVVVVVVDATSSIQIWYRFDDKLFTCSRTIFFLVGFPLLKTFYWLNPYHTNFIRSSTIDNIHYFTTKYVREQRHPNSLSSLLLLLLFSPLCIHMGVCVSVCEFHRTWIKLLSLIKRIALSVL